MGHPHAGIMAEKVDVMTTFASIPLNRKLLFILGILCIVFYLPTFNANYLYFDEYISILQNPQIQSPLSFDNLKNIFTTFTENQYTPLSIFSFWVEFNLFGYNSQIAHIVNLIIHIFGVFALFYFLLYLLENTKAAFLLAAIWAIHPMQVESVVWVLGRRTLLYGSFFIASLALYGKYIKENKNHYFWLALLAMLLSGLSKTLAFTAPFAWIAMDLLKGQKFSIKIIMEKLIAFILAIVLMITMLTAANDGITNKEEQPLNIKEAAFSIGYYPILTIFPHKLSGTNEINHATKHILDNGPLYLSVFLLFSIIISIKSKIALAGLIYYLIHIFPMSGLIRVGYPFYVSYHFCYVAQIGLLLIIYGWFKFIKEKINYKISNKLQVAVIIILLLFFGCQTYNFSLVWQNSENLFNNSLQLDPENRFARNMITKYYIAVGNFDKAEYHCKELLQKHPDFFGGYYSMSAILMQQKKIQDSEKYLNKAIEIAGYRSDVTYSRGFCRYILKNWSGADEDFSIILSYNPNNVNALLFRATARFEMGQYSLARQDHLKIFNLEPDNIQNKSQWLKNSLYSLDITSLLLIMFGSNQ